MKAVIFDLDGTLINSAIFFKKMKSMIIEHLEAVGVTPGLLNDTMLSFEITTIAMQHLRMKGVSEERANQILKEVTTIMNQVELESLDGTTIVEGVPETLKALKAKRLRLGIMTRSCREYVEKILEKFGLEEYFDAVAARDDVEKPKPNPEHALYLLGLLGISADDTVFVGDHWSDAECAEKAGLRFVLVRRRGQDFQALRECRFEAVDNIRDIVKLPEMDE